MTPYRRRRRPLTLLPTAALLLAALATGCSSGGDGPEAGPLLDAARASLGGAQSVHFVITGEDTPQGGLALLGGEGDAERPDRLQGTLQVRVAGLSADVDVLAREGAFYARLPLAPDLARTDPSTLGFGDPSELFGTGLTALLDAATDPRSTGQDRVDGTVVDTVEVTFPGEVVAEVLRSAEPGTDFRGRVSLTTDEPREVRRVVLTGPFYKGIETTYTIVLTRYGEPVEFRDPPA